MRLLILKCSARKRGGPDLLPAIDRYDGPLWQVLRSFVRAQPLFAAALDVYVLSAGFGLIPATEPIPLYDRTMDPARADELRPLALETFARLAMQDYTDLCMGLSQRYLRAVEGWQTLVPSRIQVTHTDGPMGTKLGQLRAWLEGRSWNPSPERPARVVAAEHPRGAAVIAGVNLQMTHAEVLARARAALQEDDAQADRYRDWYVLIDERRVSAKWLVSRLSNRPTSAFDAANARRVLLALGVDVEREQRARPPISS